MKIKEIFEIFFEELLLGDKLQKEKQLQEYFGIYDIFSKGASLILFSEIVSYICL